MDLDQEQGDHLDTPRQQPYEPAEHLPGRAGQPTKTEGNLSTYQHRDEDQQQAQGPTKPPQREGDNHVASAAQSSGDAYHKVGYEPKEDPASVVFRGRTGLDESKRTELASSDVATPVPQACSVAETVSQWFDEMDRSGRKLRDELAAMRQQKEREEERAKPEQKRREAREAEGRKGQEQLRGEQAHRAKDERCVAGAAFEGRQFGEGFDRMVSKEEQEEFDRKMYVRSDPRYPHTTHTPTQPIAPIADASSVNIVERALRMAELAQESTM